MTVNSGSFPRLLVATEFPPNAPGGGPAVVRQMLKEWPIEHLHWWSCRPDHDLRFGQRVARLHIANIPSLLNPGRRLVTLRNLALESIWSRWAAVHFRNSLRAAHPEIVWVIPHGWSIPPLAKVLLPRGDVPFHVTLQDYMDHNGMKRRFGPKRATMFATLADSLYATATTRDATSHPMIEDLRRRTGYEAAQMIHAGLEQSDFEFLAREPVPREGPLRIAYAGTIVVEDEFLFFVETLDRIRTKLPEVLTLEFFSSHDYRSRRWYNPAWMVTWGNLSELQLTDALRECDWGFAPMSLTDDDPRYNRFSFPTKFISYLAAGLPVITLGHPESSVMKMARGFRLGLCLDKKGVAQFEDQLLRALLDRRARASRRSEILKCAAKEFDARRMRDCLYQCLSQQRCGPRAQSGVR